MKYIENLANNLNRFYVGTLILFALIFFYFFKLDLIFFSIILFLILYDLITSKIANLQNSIISFIFILLLFNYENYINIILIIFSLMILFFTFINKYLNLFFFLFLSLVIFVFFNILIQDRDIIYLLIIASFINDTSAYFFGKILKGPRILPKISPNKTWSGTIFSFLISSFFLFLFNFNFFLILFMAASLFLGDLYFSYIKRQNNLKDFSNSLLSHGGILDRFDSLFLLVLVYSIYLFI